jgi:hypothetical protein
VVTARSVFGCQQRRVHLRSSSPAINGGCAHHGVEPNGSRAAAPPLLRSSRRFHPAPCLQVAGSPELSSQSVAEASQLEEEEDGGLDRVFKFLQGPLCIFLDPCVISCFLWVCLYSSFYIGDLSGSFETRLPFKKNIKSRTEATRSRNA